MDFEFSTVQVTIQIEIMLEHLVYDRKKKYQARHICLNCLRTAKRQKTNAVELLASIIIIYILTMTGGKYLF